MRWRRVFSYHVLRLGEHKSIVFNRSVVLVLSCPVWTSGFASAELLCWDGRCFDASGALSERVHRGLFARKALVQDRKAFSIELNFLEKENDLDRQMIAEACLRRLLPSSIRRMCE